MSRRDERREALTKIVELAQTALDGRADEHQGNGREEEPVLTCSPKTLPLRLQQTAAKLARTVNPANAPLIGASAGVFGDTPLDPMQITMLTAKMMGTTPEAFTLMGRFVSTPP